jgi:cytochrome c
MALLATLGGPSLAVAADPPAATDMPALLEQRGCHSCHHATETLIGPSYQAIAARHAPQKNVMVEVLATKIIVGGAGNWGVVPMVPSEHVSAAEARAMAAWILDQKSE